MVAARKWTIVRRLIRLLYPTELWQMVGYKVGNKTGVRMATSESENVSEVRNNPKATVNQFGSIQYCKFSQPISVPHLHVPRRKTGTINRPIDSLCIVTGILCFAPAGP